MKIAIAYADGSVHPSLTACREYMVLTVVDGKPTDKTLVDLASAGIGLLPFVGQNMIDVVICNELGIATRNALEMLGVLIVPGVTGSCDEAAAKFLVGEPQGDATVLSLCREDDPNDPMACMHDCSRCAGCGPVKVPFDKVEVPEVK